MESIFLLLSLVDESKREIAEIISGLTEEEKGILKNYLQSTDPRRGR